MHKWRAIPLMMAAVIALFILPIAYAADFELSDTCTLSDAIKAANTDTTVGDCPAGDGADTISLSGYIGLAAALPPITTEMTVEGGGYTISGNNRFRIFVVNGGTLTVNELTMTKGKADWGGAIANVNGGMLSIHDSLIFSSQASEGGAIGNEGAVTIGNSILRHNSANFRGGAIHSTGGTVTVAESSVIANKVEDEGEGGAIYMQSGTLTITDSTLTGNKTLGKAFADNDGGAVFIGGGTLTVRNSDFTRNEAGSYGGAIFITAAATNIQDSRFTDNAASYAGALFNRNSDDVRITASTFEGNSAKVAGGAISNGNWFNTMIISQSTFHGNSVADRDREIIIIGDSERKGGAIYNGGTLEIHGSTLTRNSAQDIGGAIYSSDRIQIESSTISGNKAEEEGGGLYFSELGAGQRANSVRHVTLVNNAAASGGGLYTSGGTLSLFNTIVAGNKGGDCFGRLAENVGNLIADGSCFATLSGDPMLGDLVEPEDGSLPYYPLLEDSPAIDAADSEYCLETDIVGTARPQGAGCDIGAYEWIPADN